MLDTTSIRICPANGNDLGAVRAMCNAVAAQQGTQALMTASAIDWGRSLGRNDFVADVAYVGDKIAGTVITTRSSLPGSKAGIVEIHALFVVEPYRRRGIGTKLLQHALVRAGNAVIRADVRRDDDVVRAMLRAAGFLPADGFELMVRSP